MITTGVPPNRSSSGENSRPRVNSVPRVLKSLEENYRKVDGISGATILGDGRVGFILDVSNFVTRAHHSGAHAVRHAHALAA